MLSPEDAATLQALGEAVEAVRSETEAKWGAGRLDRLAALHAPELLARFRRQQTTWGNAYQAAWAADFLSGDLLETARGKCAAMRRAWEALNTWAEEAGHRPVAPWVWEVWLADGSVAALVENDEAAAKVIAEGRQVAVYTAAEVANLIDAIPEALKLAKATWIGAKFKGPDFTRSKGEWIEAGDDIPFGDPVPPGGLSQSSNWQEDLA